jgi:hypothetical protein
MPADLIENIAWYTDADARSRREPGIFHSYLASLATALNHVSADFNPAWMMGASAFAFRTFVNERFCPSAMSVFDWRSVLTEAVEQSGYTCTHICRLWHEEEKAKERKREAHETIVDGIARGRPAIVWDIHGAEWGLIIGYEMKAESYNTLTHAGKQSTLPFSKLGQNGVDILSVVIPGEPNGRSRLEVVRKSLEAAVRHADQKEWIDRPDYQDGLLALDLWAVLHERWAMLVDAGKADRIPTDIPRFASYYAGHYYSARCYARSYLKAIAESDPGLEMAASKYEEAAASLRPVWEFCSAGRSPQGDALRSLAGNIRAARAAEEQGLEHIRKYLVSQP